MPALATIYRHAFVTGVSGGLGRAMAEMLLAEGVRVWGTARETARIQDLVTKTGFTPLALDLADSAGAERAFVDAAAQAGGVFDLVINNAGFGVFAPFAAADFSVWQRQIDAMLTTTMRLSHAALGRMLGQNRGALVNVASLAVEFPLPFMAGYNVAKAGLSALSESLIFETRGTGVNVIDFRPGDYRTAFNQSMQSLSPASPADADARLTRAWQMLEANLHAAPAPARAARDLRHALLKRRSGTVRSGSFFQACLAPLLVRFSPSGLRRAVLARYFGAV